MYARLLKTITTRGTRYLASVHNPWMPNMQLPSPRQATTRRFGAASLAPVAAPSPQPRCPAEELEKYDLFVVNRKFDTKISLLVGLSLSINTSGSKTLSMVRTRRAVLIGVSSHPFWIRASNSACVCSFDCLSAKAVERTN